MEQELDSRRSSEIAMAVEHPSRVGVDSLSSAASNASVDSAGMSDMAINGDARMAR